MKGQALVESLVGLSLLVGSLSYGIGMLDGRFRDTHQELVRAQRTIHSVVTEPEGTITNANYQLARAIQPVTRTLEQVADFELPWANRRWIKPVDSATSSPWRFNRLQHDWSAANRDYLQVAPRSLVPLAQLNRLGVTHMQALLKFFPNAREFGPSHLQFGHVDADVVPASARCEVSVIHARVSPC